MKSAKLSLFDLTMIVASLVIGMGIFRTPVNVAREAGTADIFFIAWALGGVVTLFGALTYAEIGSRYPVTGGYYKIFSHCYHPSIAFAINGIVLVSNAASVAGVALIGAEYLSNILFSQVGNTSSVRIAIAAVSICIFYGVNLRGLKMSAMTQNVLMLIKIGMMAMLIGSLFTGDYVHTFTVTPLEGLGSSGPAFFRALGICLIAVSFTYGGYQQTINFGGEVRNASKTLPRGILLGVLIVMVLYLLINYTYYKVIGLEKLKHAESIAGLLAGAIFGNKGFTILSALLFVSVLGYVNVSLMSNPRVIYAMGEEGSLPMLFGKKNKRDVMSNALTAFGMLCLLTLFYAGTFDKILNNIIFLDCIGMCTSAATIFILRRRTAGVDKSTIYSMKLYPLMPVVFIITYIFIAASIAIATPAAARDSVLIFSLFLVLYFVMSGRKRMPGNDQS